MPRRRKRAWIKYSRKVKAVIQSSLGSNFFIILRSAVVQNNLNKQAVYNGHTVMGLNGAATDTNDVSQIFDRAIAASLLSQKDSGRLMVTGWMAETQVVNSGTAPAYLDMYYWRCTRLVPAALNKFENVWSNALTDMTPNFPIGGSALDIADYGITPFQGVSRHCQIWKKVRTKLEAGEVTQVETRSGRNYYRMWGFDEEYSMAPRCTEGIFFVFYGVPTTTAAFGDTCTLRFATNVNYTWKVLENAVNYGATTQV